MVAKLGRVGEGAIDVKISPTIHQLNGQKWGGLQDCHGKGEDGGAVLGGDLRDGERCYSLGRKVDMPCSQEREMAFEHITCSILMRTDEGESDIKVTTPAPSFAVFPKTYFPSRILNTKGGVEITDTFR